ncbi:MAG: glycine-rich protein [Candidatus Omnitrophota bacterium]
MKNKFLIAVFILTLAVCARLSVAFADSQVLSYTGSQQTWDVPAGVTSITVDAYGAKGATATTGSYGVGGEGGRTQATLTVTPGDTLYIYVGGKGTSLTGGGWNGGGYGYSGFSHQPGRGGGASDIRSGGTALANRILVAGGGGGGGVQAGTRPDGGAGGTTTGADGGDANTAGCGGDGGTGSAGGTGGTFSGYGTAQPGSLGLGGGDGTTSYPTYNNLGGGGGGGYYGGGCGDWGAGGGGSSWVTATGSSSITYTRGGRADNGQITITWAAPAISLKFEGIKMEGIKIPSS